MLKGSNGDILTFVRATAGKTAFVHTEKESNAGRYVDKSPQASISFSPLLTSSLLWSSALSQTTNSTHNNTTNSTIPVGISYERINTEAKQLCLDAIERAEVRRRAKLLFTEKHKQSLFKQEEKKGEEDLNSGVEAVLNEKKTPLVNRLKEEIEGCQMWSAAATAQIPMRLFTGLDSIFTDEKKISTFHTDLCINNDNDEVHEERIQQLFETIAVLSAMLYYLRPLRNALFTISTTILSLSSLSLFDFREVLTLFEQLLSKGGIVPYMIAEILIHDIGTCISFKPVIPQCYAIIHCRGSELIRSINRIQESLKDVNAKSVLNVQVHYDTLHTLSEEELVKIRSYLQRELRQQLMIKRNIKKRSLEQSQHFLLACNKYREMTRNNNNNNNIQNIHSRRQKRERFLNSNVSSSNSLSSHRIQVEKKVELKTIISEPEKSKNVPGNVITASSNHNIISSSCWERTVIEVWRAHRESVFAVLPHYPFSLKNNNNNNNNNKKKEKDIEEGKIQNSHKLGKFVCDTKITDTIGPEELLYLLHSIIVGVPNLDTVHLLDALLDWIKGEKNILNDQIYISHAVELVVFLFAAKAYGNIDNTGSEDILLEIERLLQRMKKEYINDITPTTSISSGNSSSNSNSGNTIPLWCLSFQSLAEPLSIFLVNALFTVFSIKPKETSSSIMIPSLPLPPDTAFPSIHWVWGNNRRLLISIAGLLWYLHSSKVLNHAILILRDDKCSPHFITNDSTISNSTHFSLLQWHAHVLVLLTTIVKYGNHGTALNATIVESSFLPLLNPKFLLTIVEWLNTSILSVLKIIHVRSKKSLPRFISETLWDSLIPLSIWVLHHVTFMRNECGLEDVCRLVENCQLIINDLTLRWDYSIVPKRRYHKKETMFSLTSITVDGLKDEYEADNMVADRVIKFASLIEGELLSALDVLPHLLSNNRSFSCMCNAIGIILYDVDARTGHQIMKYLLQLVPKDNEMDIESHVAVIRCLASMRHGCTLWKDALHHYRCAVTIMQNLNNGQDKISPQNHSHHNNSNNNNNNNIPRFSHIPSDLSTARVLRCVGSSPLSYSTRCMLTLRLIAFARAAGVSLNIQSYSACLHNFTMRKESSMHLLFNHNRWCDALEWYDHILNKSTHLSSRDVLLFLTTCLQSMLAEGEWSDALLSRPLLELIRLYEGTEKLDPYDERTKVFVLLALCASDRTRSCINAAKALFHTIPNNNTSHLSVSTIKDKVLKELYHTAIADVSPDIHSTLHTTSRTPLFRYASPVIPKPTRKREETFTLLQLRGNYEVLHTQSHYTHEALVEKLTQSVFSQLHGAVKEERKEKEEEKEPEKGKRSLVQIRERVSRAFPLMKVVWTEETVNSQKMEENDENSITGDAARSLMDTRYASVMIPLRKLEKLRAEKRSGIRQRHSVLKSEKDKEKLRND